MTNHHLHLQLNQRRLREADLAYHIHGGDQILSVDVAIILERVTFFHKLDDSVLRAVQLGTDLHAGRLQFYLDPFRHNEKTETSREHSRAALPAKRLVGHPGRKLLSD